MTNTTNRLELLALVPTTSETQVTISGQLKHQCPFVYETKS
jgi:hypothetical protein